MLVEKSFALATDGEGLAKNFMDFSEGVVAVPVTKGDKDVGIGKGVYDSV